MTAGRPAAQHLDAATLDSLCAKERTLLAHVATCAGCRRRLAAAAREGELAWTPDAAAEAAILRLVRDLESGAQLDGKLAAIERERREAGTRVRELLERPDNWDRAASEPRYASLEVAWQLLAVARGEERLLALRLIDLAGEIAAGLAWSGPGSAHNRQLLVEVRCARADRLLDGGDRSGAGRELRRAARELAADLGYARALYCRALGRLRREQGRWEEALALGERAIELLDDYGSELEAGAARIELGWALNDAGDPDEAPPLFEAALPLVAAEPRWAVNCRQGLAVALAAAGDTAAASGLLAAADRLTARVDEPGPRLRLRWQGAQAAWRCGQSGSAFRRLSRVVAGLLALGEDRDAAGALLELLAMCVERRFWRAFGMTVVQVALGALYESPRLDRRARAVVELVDFALADPERRAAAEVIANARRYLVDSRDRPELAFRPTRPVMPLVHLTWDELEPRIRGDICVDVGVAEEIGRRQARDLEAGLRDLISWRFEVVRRVRIEFAPRGRREPPAS